MEKIVLFDIVNHVVLNARDMEGIQKDVWEECFQWVMLDQACTFQKVNPALAGLEIASVWVMWYYDQNMREYLNAFHTKYSGYDISNPKIYESIRDEIYVVLNKVLAHYNGELGWIGNLSSVSATDYANFFNIAVQTFEFNPEYDFGRFFGKCSRVENTADGYRMVVMDINLK